MLSAVRALETSPDNPSVAEPEGLIRPAQPEGQSCSSHTDNFVWSPRLCNHSLAPDQDFNSSHPATIAVC